MLNNALPEICSLDCGSLNFGDSTMLAVNTPNDIRKAAKRLKEIDVKPEIEAFDLGNMWFGTQLVKEGLIKDPPLVSNLFRNSLGCSCYSVSYEGIR